VAIDTYLTNNLSKLIYAIYFTLLIYLKTIKSFNFYVYSVLQSELKEVNSIQQIFLWIKWRTEVNKNLAHDLLSQSYHDIGSMQTEKLLQILSRPGVYRYGIIEDCSTSLNEQDFINFGIPRVTLEYSRLSAQLSVNQSNVASTPSESIPHVDY